MQDQYTGLAGSYTTNPLTGEREPVNESLPEPEQAQEVMPKPAAKPTATKESN